MRKREGWRKSVPNTNMNVRNNTVICQLHWHSNFDTKEVHGKMHLKNLPSVWPGVPESHIPISSAVKKDIQKLQYCSK